MHSKCKDVMPRLKKWLVEGVPNAENLVDLPWEVEEQKDGSLIAVYPRFPIRINVICDDEISVVRLFVSTSVSTIDLEVNDRLRIYHKLLKMNAAPMTKFILYGDDDEIHIAVDLSTKTLGKREFNDSLALLLTSVNAVVQAFNLEEFMAQQMFSEIIRLVAKHVDEGWGREKLVQYLVERAGMSRDDAVKLVDQILSSRAPEGPSIFQ